MDVHGDTLPVSPPPDRSEPRPLPRGGPRFKSSITAATSTPLFRVVFLLLMCRPFLGKDCAFLRGEDALPQRYQASRRLHCQVSAVSAAALPAADVQGSSPCWLTTRGITAVCSGLCGFLLAPLVSHSRRSLAWRGCSQDVTSSEGGRSLTLGAGQGGSSKSHHAQWQAFRRGCSGACCFRVWLVEGPCCAIQCLGSGCGSRRLSGRIVAAKTLTPRSSHSIPSDHKLGAFSTANSSGSRSAAHRRRAAR